MIAAADLPEPIKILARQAEERQWRVELDGDAFRLSCPPCDDDHFFTIDPVTSSTFRLQTALDYLNRHTCWDREGQA